MLTAIDPLLIAIALFAAFVGFEKRWASWRMGRDERLNGDWLGLIGYLLWQRKILERGWIGIAHLILFWGLLFPLIIIIFAQFRFVMPSILANFVSLLLDILGAAFVVGATSFLVRRIKASDPLGPRKVIFPVVLLLVILFTGFMAEGARLSITHGGFHWPSPVGWGFSLFLPASPLLMQAMIRIHFILVLLFIALLPFTFMRHLAAGVVNVYYRDRETAGIMRPVRLEEGPWGAKTIRELSWKDLLEAEACVSCGRCEERCPAFNAGKPLSPRKVMGNILEQAEEVRRREFRPGRLPSPLLEERITADEIWSCTTCMACVESCPIFVQPADKIVEMRRYQVLGRGLLPNEARPRIRNLEIFGDAEGKGVARKEDWAYGLDVPHIGLEGLHAEVLLWVGCSGAFHPRGKEAMRAMVHILKSGGVRFGILGKEELCCGDMARRLGEEEVFLDLASKNMASFEKYHIRRIVTLCPHGFHTFKNEYPALGANIEVIHAVEFVLKLIEQKRIAIKYPMVKRIAIQDPCYLGRVNQLYEPLRKVAQAVPGLRFEELPYSREKAFCCGGGGGRVWLREKAGTSISNMRAKEIKKSGVELLGTACPFCLAMLEDGIRSLEMENPPKVLDIIEIVSSSME